MNYLLIIIIKIYQKTLGLVWRGNCKFHPTCSEYMIQSLKKYGLIKGGSKGVMRLLRCHPYSNAYGIDEV